MTTLADLYFTLPRPWEPVVPEPPAEAEGEEEAAPAAPSKDAAPEGAEEEAPAPEEAAAPEATPEELADPITRLVDGILLPRLRDSVAVRLAELASAA